MKTSEVLAQLQDINDTRVNTKRLIQIIASKGYVTEAKILARAVLAKNEPLDKDIKRMADLKKKAGKDETKAFKLARTQAKHIEDASKAQRRAKAAKSVIKGKLGDKVAKVFQARYNWLKVVEA